MRLLKINIVGACFALAAALAVGNTAGTLALVGVTGLFFSTQIPLIISIASNTYREVPAAAAGGLFALGGLGGAVIPAAVGMLAVQTSLRTALAACVPLIAMMLILRTDGAGSCQDDSRNPGGPNSPLAAKPPKSA